MYLNAAKWMPVWIPCTLGGCSTVGKAGFGLYTLDVAQRMVRPSSVCILERCSLDSGFGLYTCRQLNGWDG